MRLNDVFCSKTPELLYSIKERCADFIGESGGHPLLKTLPESYNDVHKVKVRKRKQRSDLSEAFNGAFESKLQNIRQRAVFANGVRSYENNSSGESFYIFPIDGYRYLYSTEVQNSSQDYKAVFDALHEEFGPQKGSEMITDLLKFSYTSSMLNEGIELGAEIIIYNIPYFYAVRTSAYESYEKLLIDLT